MASLGEKITEQRKQLSLTQQQLADAVGVTRQCISSWERDLTIPDIASLKRISETLNYDFMLGQTAPEPETAAKTSAKAYKKYLIPAACFLAGVLVALLAVGLFTPRSAGRTPSGLTVARKPESDPVPDTVSWFKTADIAAEGEPYIYISFSENPCLLERDEAYPEGTGWNYSAYLTEYNGHKFHMTAYTQYLFADESHSTSWTYTEEDFNKWWGNSDIDARGQKIISSGMPSQDLKGLGIRVTGTDEAGKELSFYGFMDVSQEIKP